MRTPCLCPLPEDNPNISVLGFPSSLHGFLSLWCELYATLEPFGHISALVVRRCAMSMRTSGRQIAPESLSYLPRSACGCKNNYDASTLSTMLSIAIVRVDGVVGVGGAFPSACVTPACNWVDVCSIASPSSGESSVSPTTSSISLNQFALSTSMGGSRSPGFPPLRASAALIFLSPRCCRLSYMWLECWP